jgi:hypothetical protein
MGSQSHRSRGACPVSVRAPKQAWDAPGDRFPTPSVLPNLAEHWLRTDDYGLPAVETFEVVLSNNKR